MTSVELKTFTYAKGFQSLSIDNAILGLIPKRLIFAMVDNGEFLGSLTRNPFRLQHFDDLFYTIRQRKTYLATVYTWTPTAIKKSVVIQVPLRGVRYSSLELRTLAIARLVSKRLFHATLRTDARSECVGRP